MPRPSQRIDQALLASGRELLPTHGCAGLTVRVLADHAGTAPAMVHYHFGSKEQFLQTLLGTVYEAMFDALVQQAAIDGSAVDRLRAALRSLARFVRTQRTLIVRLWADAAAGESVARAFFQHNAPRHIGVLMSLLVQGQDSGALRRLPPATAFSFLVGAVALPSLFLGGLVDAGVPPPGGAQAFEAQVLSDDAIEARIDLALQALSVPSPSPAP
jgi:AcrR family transcriptional regulator